MKLLSKFLLFPSVLMILLACGGGGGSTSGSVSTSPAPPLSSGPHTLSFSLNLPAVSTPVNGITFIAQLPIGANVTTNGSMDSSPISSSALLWGNAVGAPQIISAYYTASTRQIKIHMISTVSSPWSGEFIKIKVSIAPGFSLYDTDFTSIGSNPSVLKIIAINATTHTTVDLSSQSTLTTKLLD